MQYDLQSYSLPGATAAAADLYGEALRAFHIYRGDPLGLLDQATAAAPEFAMAHIAKAHLLGTSAEPAGLAQCRALLEIAKALPLVEREQSHVAALEHLTRGDWSRAAVALDRHNIEYPRDLLALQSGHLIDFLRAAGRNLRDRIARVLPSWSADVPGYPIVVGMYAFGLEECGDYSTAEERGRQALDLEPLDCWAHHAVTHVMEMQGRAEEGIRWMSDRQPYWSGEDNFFKVHNWWHRALFSLALGRGDEALALYDDRIRKDRSTVVLDLVDASALLWRAHLAGFDIDGRWQELADAWELHADGRTYPFNDWHAAMAFLGAGRYRDAERLAAALHDSAAGASEVNRWAREFGLPLTLGFMAFWQARHGDVVEHLFAVRNITNAFGGSHAQRDIIDLTLLEAARRDGRKALTQALVNERLALRACSAMERTRSRDSIRNG